MNHIYFRCSLHFPSLAVRCSMNQKKYIGRQLRPSQLAKEILPADSRWCTACHKSILKKEYSLHAQTLGHRLAVRKLNKMKGISLSMWEKHRGASMDEESKRAAFVEAEYTHFRADQKRREEMEVQKVLRNPFDY
ncbi:hypothetical protein STCU_02538 [Strigomonas culicis]|uniref:Uncharacterized protein n=1 Tax=Strigomonas culicis TaxID=28005 RepID=S9W0J5_9TRYP|nr:hypothetical protein STCU_03774 [Strigomonas culicis]EPY33001.1 hypothetical protein STCU_02538 [Strigomonas culicis]|eukprot:EPY30929.1 hypothetical protein STCU_03774 [Strigomonas culicis]